MSQERLSTHEGWELVDKPHIQWNNSQVGNTEFPKVFPKGTKSQLPSEVTYSLLRVLLAFLSSLSLSLTLSMCFLESPPK